MNYRNVNYSDPDELKKAFLKLACCSGAGTIVTDGDGTQYLANDGTYKTLSTGLTDGTTPIASGTDADMFYNNGGVWTSMNSTNFYYDDTFAAGAGVINVRNLKTDNTLSFYIGSAQRMYLESGGLWTDRRIIVADHLTGNGANGTTVRCWNTSNNIMTWQTNASVTVGYIDTAGQVNFSALPTSSAGLVAGDLWNNSGVVNIV